MTVECEITRTLVGSGLPALRLNSETTGIRLLRVRRGVRVPIHDLARSPVIAGAVPARTTWDLVTSSLTIRIEADTVDAVHYRRDSVEQALRQARYTVALTIDGERETWSCIPGSLTEAGGDVDAAALAAGWQDYELTFQRQPF